MSQQLRSFSRFLIRVSAFLRKEIFEIMRQPMLLFTLVLGPFLILLFFGIGYRNDARALRTVFVVEPNSPMTAKIEQYASSLGPQLIFSGVISDLEKAQTMLYNNEVDLITQVPAEPLKNLRNNQQSMFTLYHQEIDPIRTQYVDVFGRVYVNEINRRILRLITELGQTDLRQIEESLNIAEESTLQAKELLELCVETLDEGNQCSSEAIRQQLRQLDRSIDEMELSTGDRARLMDAVERGLDNPEELLVDFEETLETEPLSTSNAEKTITDIVENTNRIADMGDQTDAYIEQLELLSELEDDLAILKARILEFVALDPQVLVTPFRVQSRSMAEVVPNPAAFFAPAVIALLLQHLTITFASLSMVRERQLGTMELFYASPLSAFEVLLGKYLSYLLFGGILATILTLLVVYGMNVPMLGNYYHIALTLLLLIFTSLGLGFVISLISKTDTQAVQYSMIVLLSSVFFSGFILGLDTLTIPIRFIAYGLPATYGIILMRSIMLRGSEIDMTVLIMLALFGIGLFLIAWRMLRRSMAYG